jgi:hypothetical protein
MGGRKNAAKSYKIYEHGSAREKLSLALSLERKLGRG